MALEPVRRLVTFRIDERVLEVLKAQAARENRSANNWVETQLIVWLKEAGALASDFEPLGETRGGDRSKKKEENNA